MARARLRARHIVTSQSVVEDGAVLVGDDGAIASVGSNDAVPLPPGCPAHDHGDAVILPGLTNAHTHLELTGLNGGLALAEPDFALWIRRLRELKARWTREDFARAAREGIRQCFRQGVTMVAETGDTGVVPEALAEAGMQGVVYQEVFGPDPVLVRESIQELERQVDQLLRWESGRVRIGVSPHAPYTVSGPLYREASRWARARNLPLAVHIAESVDESALLAAGTGAFADAWRRRNLPMPEPLGLTPVSYLAHWDVWGPERGREAEGMQADVLAIHAVRVPADDLAHLRSTGAMMAWCPLANRAHGHGDAPAAEYLARGGVVGLGTDSELSVGPIDLLAVAREARARLGWTARETVRMLCGAAAALPAGLGGRHAEAVGLEVGAPADLAVFPCPSGADPFEAVLTPPAGAALETWAAGRLVHRFAPGGAAIPG